MVEEELLAVGVNYKGGIKRFGGKSAIYEKYLAKFPMDTNYNDMMLALEQKDYDAAFKHAHALKGLAGNLSLDKLYKQIVPLVEALRVGQLSNLDILVSAVSENYLRITQAITCSEQVI